MKELKAAIDRLRDEHTLAHRMCEDALDRGDVENVDWLFRLAGDLFEEFRRTNQALERAMEEGR